MYTNPAFPVVIPNSSTYRGMTQLDYFAACALQGLLSGKGIDHVGEQLAPVAYNIAEAMIEESLKRNT